MELVDTDPARSRVARLLRRTSFIIDGDDVDELAEQPFDDVVARILDDRGEAGTPPRDDTEAIITWWLDRLLAPSSGLYERMVWFWHTHLTTSHLDVIEGLLGELVD
ncbi:MAG: DUF1800 family protein, partial [Actinomycetota bacterium]